MATTADASGDVGAPALLAIILVISLDSTGCETSSSARRVTAGALAMT